MELQHQYPADIRRFPAQEKRVECGPIAFGNDWPGLFIRGDTAAFYAMYLRALIDETPSAEPELFRSIIARNVMVALANALESCDLTRRVPEQPPQPQSSPQPDQSRTHERRVVGHLSGYQEQMSTCICGKPWPCPDAVPSA